MGKVSKATKKFQKKHLGAAIKQRRAHKRKKQQEAARASKRPAGEGHSSENDEQEGKPRKPLEDMSIDEFLDGGFLDVAAQSPAAAQPSDDESEDEDDLSVSDLEGSSEDEQPLPAAAANKTVAEQKQQQQEAGRKRKQHAASNSEEEGPVVSDDEPYDSEAEEERGSEESGSGSEGSEEKGGSEGEENVAVTSSSDDDDNDKGRPRSKAELKREMEAHKAQLEKLREQDPEFYAYLQSTDQELLNFGKDSDDEVDSDGDEEEDGDGEEAGEGPAEPAAAAKSKSGMEKAGVTLEMVEGWCTAAKENATLGAVRNIIKAYRAACHYGDSEEQVEESMRIASSAVYNKLMLFVLREIDGIFRRMLMEGASAKQQVAPLTAVALIRLPRWKKLEPLIKSYLGNTLHLLGALTDSAMLTFILRRVRASTVMLAPFEKLQRRLLKAALGLFGSADNAPRVQAVLLVRQMALELPQPALDNCLKGVYRAYASNAKFVNAASMPQINFMAAAVVEMYGINTAASYQHAFSFIRQLAVLLRSALTSKSKEAYREVYCWQTVNCLELWAKLLAAKADEQELRPLIYPVTQLLLGVARLVPAPAFFPLRLRCVRALNRLGEATGTFIPVAPICLEVLQWSDLRRAPKQGAGQQPDVLLTLRVSKAAMRGAQYQEEIINQVMELLAEHLACWGCHIAFPELSFLTLTQMRKFMKTTPVERFRKAARQLVEAVEKNVTFVGRARDQVEFSPKDLAQVANFLAKENAAKQAPIQQYARSLMERARQRLQMRLADEIELGTARGGEDSEDDEVPSGSLLPKKQRKPQQDDDSRAAKRQKRAAAVAADSSDEDEEDRGDAGAGSGSEGSQEDADVAVKPYELSDDDGDDEQGGYAAPDFDSSEDDDGESEEEVRPKKLPQQQQHPQQSSGHHGGRDGGRGRGSRHGGKDHKGIGGRDGGRGFGRSGRRSGGRGGGGRGGRGGGRSGRGRR